MSHPNAADRVLAKMFPDGTGRSDMEQSALATILMLLSNGALVSDTATPFATVIAAINTNCPDGAAKVAALSMLNPPATQESQSY